jgi:hypothetical protein
VECPDATKWGYGDGGVEGIVRWSPHAEITMKRERGKEGKREKILSLEEYGKEDDKWDVCKERNQRHDATSKSPRFCVCDGSSLYQHLSKEENTKSLTYHVRPEGHRRRRLFLYPYRLPSSSLVFSKDLPPTKRGKRRTPRRTARPVLDFLLLHYPYP